MTKQQIPLKPAGGTPVDCHVMPAVGDYVLATKYSDGDPGDAWALGFYAGTLEQWAGTTVGTPARYMVVDGNNKNIRGNGFRRVARIRKDVGRWLLEVAAPHLERCPPGTVNIWTMLTPAAFDLERDEQA
jgi:hypothetical protein